VEVPFEGNPFRPFCSERCQLTDLGAWAGEKYRIPGATMEQDMREDRDRGNGKEES
jgi:endogenous inhibitor of DNA gyrase (YacG/DUF329 family)